MKGTVFLLISLFASLLAEAQVAIINDKDGYTNVRKEPNAQSPIIYKITSNTVFWYEDQEGQNANEWTRVYVSEDDFSLNVDDTNYIEGFIHTSRLQPLEQVKVYKGSDFAFKYAVEPFKLEGRSVKKQNGQWVETIGGKKVWGTDGGFPKTQVKGVKVSIAGKSIPISKNLYADIYECTNEFKVYKNGDTYFVYQWNSDGAGAYQVVWVFNTEGLKQRLVGSMI
ncbi:hypothetical protein TH61_04120 [Rufibacter sp. DG15C]|uniref:hypothetical protein n=1 Tax=Rufibacter sp. DG15C TaxID=1379909 RepID=UPI00078EA704|nr:hypothetical protein [Rufibacter sp. DG15C]AMM50521.1 hypothetical protein TH61_04120 [Rufibacter sp. DG15C]